MKKILIFGKYFGYNVGGAEKSTYEILKQKDKENYNIELISFADIDTLGANSKKIIFPQKWKLSFIKDIYLFNKFFYYEYLFNRNKIKTYFSDLETSTELYTYAIYAPVAINSFQGKSKLFIRSETDLAINTNYYTGIKKYFKNIYIILEYPAFFIYKKDLEKAIQKADVVCNSKYMAKKLKEFYAKESEVLYPYIDEERLKKEFVVVSEDIQEKGIVFVGDAIIKGVNIAKDIAKKMPSEKFYFFSRYIQSPTIEQNIVWMPWQSKEVDIYKHAKLVIVPSIGEEAYGRVSRESYILGIPVLVSNIGGLPESVDEKKEFIVDDYKNIEEWRKKIENTI
jgi:glycosyltransferase involved in cell wall biosynthesis